MNAFSLTHVRRSVIVTPMERAPLAYFVVIVRLFRYGSFVAMFSRGFAVMIAS